MIDALRYSLPDISVYWLAEWVTEVMAVVRMMTSTSSRLSFKNPRQRYISSGLHAAAAGGKVHPAAVIDQADTVDATSTRRHWRSCPLDERGLSHAD